MDYDEDPPPAPDDIRAIEDQVELAQRALVDAQSALHRARSAQR